MAENMVTKRLTGKPNRSIVKLTSHWTVKSSTFMTVTRYDFDQKPTTDKAIVMFTLNGAVPSNATNITAVVVSSNPLTGMQVKYQCEKVNIGDKEVKCTFSGVWIGSCGTDVSSRQYKTSDVQITNVVVRYDVPKQTQKVTDPGKTEKTEPKKPIAALIDYKNDDRFLEIYDTKTKEVYAFDGVLKVQYNMANSIEDDSTKSDDAKFTNNAKLSPTEISVDFIMSEVHNTVSALTPTTDSGSRCSDTLLNLNKIKDERHILEVSTSIATIKNMLVKSVTVTQDDTGPLNLTGTIVLHERLEIKDKSAAKGKTKTVTAGVTSSLTAETRAKWEGKK